jgi:hypothetical protein
MPPLKSSKRKRRNKYSTTTAAAAVAAPAAVVEASVEVVVSLAAAAAAAQTSAKIVSPIAGHSSESVLPSPPPPLLQAPAADHLARLQRCIAVDLWGDSGAAVEGALVQLSAACLLSGTERESSRTNRAIVRAGGHHQIVNALRKWHSSPRIQALSVILFRLLLPCRTEEREHYSKDSGGLPLVGSGPAHGRRGADRRQHVEFPRRCPRSGVRLCSAGCAVRQSPRPSRERGTAAAGGGPRERDHRPHSPPRGHRCRPDRLHGQCRPAAARLFGLGSTHATLGRRRRRRSWR